MMTPLGETAEDAERWWQAYLLAETDQVEELRERANAGDEHARRQLASWLGDRVRSEEAIEVIRPLADAGDDVAKLWLARWLADCDRVDELRHLADNGSSVAQEQLAEWLRFHERLDELRQLISAHQEDLACWLGRQSDMSVVRLAAELGDEHSRQRLERWLNRVKARGVTVDEQTFRVRGDNPDWATDRE